MSDDIIEDRVMAVDMGDAVRVCLADWTPAWAYDVLYARVLDSKSIDMSEATHGDTLGRARLDTENERLEWFHPE